jgi:hypothetical protein
MADKRRIELNPRPTAPPTEERPEGDDDDPSWKEWFRHDFLRYCFFALSLAALVFIPLEISRDIRGNEGLIFAVIAVVVLIVLEFFIYRMLWPREGEPGEDS